MNGGGDQLARGAKSATFGPPRGITQKRWDAIWEEDLEPIRKKAEHQKIEYQKICVIEDKVNGE